MLKWLNAVKSSFTRSWDGYKKHAWMKDELTPAEAGHVTMDDFERAVRAAKAIDFVALVVSIQN